MSILSLRCRKKEGINMKKMISATKSKLSIVYTMNICALAIASYTINVTCFWAHHQPKVPEEAKRLRKF